MCSKNDKHEISSLDTERNFREQTSKLINNNLTAVHTSTKQNDVLAFITEAMCFV